MTSRSIHSVVLAALVVGLAVPALAAPLDIPVNTWVRRPRPASGQGPCPGQCKHVRMAFNPSDGRIYFCGGDYGGAPYIDSGRQEVWSYGVADSSWRLEHPYCGPAGATQPSHPDEVGWVYDTRRNKFWMVPGYMGQVTTDCPDVATPRWEMMTFDPATDRWTLENRTELHNVNLGDNGFAQYDPVTDTIIQFFYASCSGVGIYDIATDTWTRKCLSNLPFVSKEYTAMDLVDRVIYVIDGSRNVLYRYDMDTQTVEAVGDAPAGAGSTQTHPVWDPVNRVILWFDYESNYFPAGGRLHVYHPDTNTWEVNKPIYQPEGSTVFGNNVVFDPVQNVLMAMGSTTDGTPYFYLYRYANGGPPPPPDLVPPAAPASLRPR
ncbi:MAG TPA: hypothetical protein VFM17_07785 [Candidatus Eisenbacteria bacterium]|nr:hypothetical protein [Candidatus Eisenbacteria bacterium]